MRIEQEQYDEVEVFRNEHIVFPNKKSRARRGKKLLRPNKVQMRGESFLANNRSLVEEELTGKESS